MPAGELDQGTSVKPPAMWPESALTSTSEGEAPSHAAWKALACKYCPYYVIITGVVTLVLTWYPCSLALKMTDQAWPGRCTQVFTSSPIS